MTAVQYFASVAGSQVVSGSLLVPLVGPWTADLTLAGIGSLAGQVPVVIGNLTLLGTVYRSQAYGGYARVRLVAGYGGWRNDVPHQAYGSPSGVQLSTVLNDTAMACGEKIVAPTAVNVGPAWVRADAVASDVLWQAVAQGYIPAWRVDAAGTTQCTSWPPASITTPYTVTDQRPDEGVVQVATEDYASWMPGVSFANPLLSGTYTSTGVHYIFENNGKFRFEVLTGGAQDRLVGALNAIIAKQVAPTKFYGRYAYTIEAATNSTVDASPVNRSVGLPDVQNVPICSDSISTYIPPIGSACHLQFLNGSQTQPICVWTAGAPTIVQLDGGAIPVAREGDTVQVQFLPVDATLIFVQVAPLPAPPVPCTSAGFILTGTIIAGSPTVQTR